MAIMVENEPYLVMGVFSQWRMFTGAGAPPTGWNMDVNFDASGSNWASVTSSNLIATKAGWMTTMPSRVALFGGCAKL